MTTIARGITEPVRLMTATLDGKRIAFSSETVFYVQVSRGRGSYKDRFVVVGSLRQAVMLYNGVNVEVPYKKRLAWSGSNRPLARASGL